MLAFTLSLGFSIESMSTWWRPLENDHGDSDDWDSGEAKSEAAEGAAPGSRKTHLCAISEFPSLNVPTLQMDRETGRDYAGEHRGCDLRDVEPPPSLLVQPHIRTLLLIEGIYSVCFVLFIGINPVGGRAFSVSQA